MKDFTRNGTTLENTTNKKKMTGLSKATYPYYVFIREMLRVPISNKTAGSHHSAYSQGKQRLRKRNPTHAPHRIDFQTFEYAHLDFKKD